MKTRVACTYYEFKIAYYALEQCLQNSSYYAQIMLNIILQEMIYNFFLS